MLNYQGVNTCIAKRKWEILISLRIPQNPMIMIWPIPNCHLKVSAFGHKWMCPTSWGVSPDGIWCSFLPSFHGLEPGSLPQTRHCIALRFCSATETGFLRWFDFGESQVPLDSLGLVRCVCPANHVLKSLLSKNHWRCVALCKANQSDLQDVSLAMFSECVCVWCVSEPRLQDSWMGGSKDWAYCWNDNPKHWDGLTLNRWTSSGSTKDIASMQDASKYKIKHSGDHNVCMFSQMLHVWNIYLHLGHL